MTARNDFLVTRQYGADWQASLRYAELRFAYGFGHEFEMIGFSGHRSRLGLDLAITNGFGGLDHLGRGRKSELFEIRRVRHRHVLARHAHHRRIEIVESVLHDT